MRILYPKYERILFLFFIGILPLFTLAQNYREGVKKGNEHYEKGEYDLAAKSYQESAESDPEGFEAQFNLGDALYKQGRTVEALDAYQKSAELAQNKEDKAAALHNIGNSFQKLEMYEQAAEAYKQALKNNPKDRQTRYNLARAQRALMLKEEPGGDGDDNDNTKEQENDGEEKETDEEGKKEKDGEGKSGNQPGDQKQQGNDQNQEQEGQGQDQPKEGGSQEAGQPQDVNNMSRQDAERLLEAVQREEAKTQKELIKKESKKPKSKKVKDW